MIVYGYKTIRQMEVSALFNDKYPDIPLLAKMKIHGTTRVDFPAAVENHSGKQNIDGQLAMEEDSHTSSRQVALDHKIHYSTIIATLKKKSSIHTELF